MAYLVLVLALLRPETGVELERSAASSESSELAMLDALAGFIDLSLGVSQLSQLSKSSSSSLVLVAAVVFFF